MLQNTSKYIKTTTHLFKNRQIFDRQAVFECWTSLNVTKCK